MVAEYKTDKFLTGVLYQSYQQLSGKYKITVRYSPSDGMYSLHLSDYNGFSVPIDMGQDFMPQLSLFLRTIPKHINNSDTKYAVYRRNGIISQHIPLLIADDKYPNHFVINQVPNTDINILTLAEMYQLSNTVDVICLKKLGLHNIFDEIREYIVMNPVELHWRDSNESTSITINGWNYQEGCVGSKTISLYNDIKENTECGNVDWLTERVLKEFAESDIIYPLYINLEFEFQNQFNEVRWKQPYRDYVTSDFQNFYGYLAYTTKVTDNGQGDGPLLPKNYTDAVGKKVGYKIINMLDTDSASYKSTFSDYIRVDADNYTAMTVKDIVEHVSNTVSLQETSAKNHRVDLIINAVNADAEWVLKFDNNVTRFKYESKVPLTLRESVTHLANKIGRHRLIDCNVSNDIRDKFGNIVGVRLSFVSNKSFDIKLLGTVVTNLNVYPISNDKTYAPNLTSVNITDMDTVVSEGVIPSFAKHIYETDDSKKYEIEKTFRYNDMTVVRTKQKIQISSLKSFNIKQTWEHYWYNLSPIPFLSTYFHSTDVVVHKFKEFLEALKTNVNKHVIENIVNSIKEPSNIGLVNKTPHDNIFVNGCNSFIEPRPMNFDFSQYDKYDFCDGDYTHFLIGTGDKEWGAYTGQINTPSLTDYINSIKHRYACKDYHNRSLIKRINSNFAETVFLGIKYTFDIKYDGYRFSNILNIGESPNNENTSVNYVDVNNVDKTIDLYTNLTLPLKLFDITKKFIDPGLFQNINEYFELSSEEATDKRKISISVKDLHEVVNYNSGETNDIEVTITALDGQSFDVRGFLNKGQNILNTSLVDDTKVKVEFKGDGNNIVSIDGESRFKCSNIIIQKTTIKPYNTEETKTYSLRKANDKNYDEPKSWFMVLYQLVDDKIGTVSIYPHKGSPIIINTSNISSENKTTLDYVEKFYSRDASWINIVESTISIRYKQAFVDYVRSRSVNGEFYVTRFDVDSDYYYTFKLLDNFISMIFANTIYSKQFQSINRNQFIKTVNNTNLSIRNTNELITIRCYPMSVNSDPKKNILHRYGTHHNLFTKDVKESEFQKSSEFIYHSHVQKYGDRFGLSSLINKMIGFWNEYNGLVSTAYIGNLMTVDVKLSELRYTVYNNQYHIDVLSIIDKANLTSELNDGNMMTREGVAVKSVNSEYWNQPDEKIAIILREKYVNFLNRVQVIDKVYVVDGINTSLIQHNIVNLNTIAINMTDAATVCRFVFKYR